MSEKEIEFWDCSDDVELLYWKSVDEAVEMHLDQIPPDEWPETVEVYGYVRKDKPSADKLADDVLEQVLESLDCSYELGNPEDSACPSEHMKKAANEFAQIVLDEYEVFSCEIEKTVHIEVTPWVRENAPEWLEEK